MNSSVRSMAAAALMTALMCLMAQIAVPVGVTKLTMQTFSAALAGFLLKPKAAVMAVGAYLMLGACGLPVFSGFTGGIGVLMGPTGGFLIGFMPMTALCSLSRGRKKSIRIGMLCAGLMILYLAGAAVMALASGIGFGQAMMIGVVPFVWKDGLSIAGAGWIGRKMEKRGLKSYI